MGLTRTTRGLDNGFFDECSSYSDWTMMSGSAWSCSGGVLVPSGNTSMIRKDTSKTIRCFTAKCFYTTRPRTASVQLWSHETNQTGYHSVLYSDGELRLRRDGGYVVLATGASSVFTNDQYNIVRVYESDGVLYAKAGATDLSLAALSASDDTYEGPFYAGFRCNYNVTEVVDWCDARPSHLITASGLTEGWYLRVSDGVSTPQEAAASGAGVASVDAGSTLFPLATVQVRTAAAGGGTLIAELDTGDYADMGGGDAFTYSASGLWLPHLIKPQYFPQFGGLTYG